MSGDGSQGLSQLLLSPSAAPKMMIHEFVLIRGERGGGGNRQIIVDDDGDDDDEDGFQSGIEKNAHEKAVGGSSSSSSSSRDDDRYEMEQGENWLKLLRRGGKSVLDYTQEINNDNDINSKNNNNDNNNNNSQRPPFQPSILSLSALGFVDAPSKDCYLCIDVDETVLTVKDMRLPPTMKDDDGDDDDEEGDSDNVLGFARGVEDPILWQRLPRRTMKSLLPRDLLCTSLTQEEQGGELRPGPQSLVLEYCRSFREEAVQREDESMYMERFKRRTGISPIAKRRSPEDQSPNLLDTPGGNDSVTTQPPTAAGPGAPSPILASPVPSRHGIKPIVLNEEKLSQKCDEEDDNTQLEPVQKDMSGKENYDDDDDDDDDKTVELASLPHSESGNSSNVTGNMILTTQPKMDTSEDDDDGDDDDETTLGEDHALLQDKKSGNSAGAKDNEALSAMNHHHSSPPATIKVDNKRGAHREETTGLQTAEDDVDCRAPESHVNEVEEEDVAVKNLDEDLANADKKSKGGESSQGGGTLGHSDGKVVCHEETPTNDAKSSAAVEHGHNDDMRPTDMPDSDDDEAQGGNGPQRRSNGNVIIGPKETTNDSKAVEKDDDVHDGIVPPSNSNGKVVVVPKEATNGAKSSVGVDQDDEFKDYDHLPDDDSDDDDDDDDDDDARGGNVPPSDSNGKAVVQAKDTTKGAKSSAAVVQDDEFKGIGKLPDDDSDDDEMTIGEEKQEERKPAHQLDKDIVGGDTVTPASGKEQPKSYFPCGSKGDNGNGKREGEETSNRKNNGDAQQDGQTKECVNNDRMGEDPSQCGGRPASPKPEKTPEQRLSQTPSPTLYAETATPPRARMVMNDETQSSVNLLSPDVEAPEDGGEDDTQVPGGDPSDDRNDVGTPDASEPTEKGEDATKENNASETDRAAAASDGAPMCEKSSATIAGGTHANQREPLQQKLEAEATNLDGAENKSKRTASESDETEGRNAAIDHGDGSETDVSEVLLSHTEEAPPSNENAVLKGNDDEQPEASKSPKRDNKSTVVKNNPQDPSSEHDVVSSSQGSQTAPNSKTIATTGANQEASGAKKSPASETTTTKGAIEDTPKQTLPSDEPASEPTKESDEDTTPKVSSSKSDEPASETPPKATSSEPTEDAPKATSRKTEAVSRKRGPVDEEVADTDVTTPATKRSRTRQASSSRSSARKDTSGAEPSETLSTRKRSRQSSRTGSSPDNGTPPIRVMTTGVTLTPSQKKFIERFGGVLLENIDDAATATHIIAGDGKSSLRRTPKLMIGLCCTANIVSLEWLVKSARAKKILPTNDFRLLEDKDAEEQYNFSMRETLSRSYEMRKMGQTLLGGLSVHVCAGVAGHNAKGNKTPPANEFRLIVEAAGATWIPSIPASITKSGDYSNIVLVTSKVVKEAKKQLSSKRLAEAVENGARVLTTEKLFDSMMTQQLD